MQLELKRQWPGRAIYLATCSLVVFLKTAILCYENKAQLFNNTGHCKEANGILYYYVNYKPLQNEDDSIWQEKNIQRELV